jgi:hypothetical protein
MAYVSPEKKAALSPKIKEICNRYKVKATIAVDNRSSLVLNIKSGPIDFIKNCNEVLEERAGGVRNSVPTKDYLQVNTYWYHEHFSGIAKEFLSEIIPAMKGPDFYDHSDIMTDYFSCSHYIDIHVGKWNKPYVVTA